MSRKLILGEKEEMKIERYIKGLTPSIPHKVETSNYVFFDDVLSALNSNNSSNEGKMIVVTPEQTALAKKVCFKCQGVGHIARDCGNEVTVSKKEHRMLLAYLDQEEKVKESACLLNTEEEFDFKEFEGQEKITPKPEHRHIDILTRMRGCCMVVGMVVGGMVAWCVEHLVDAWELSVLLLVLWTMVRNHWFIEFKIFIRFSSSLHSKIKYSGCNNHVCLGRFSHFPTPGLDKLSLTSFVQSYSCGVVLFRAVLTTSNKAKKKDGVLPIAAEVYESNRSIDVGNDEIELMGEKTYQVMGEYLEKLEEYKNKGVEINPDKVYLEVVGMQKNGKFYGIGSASQMYYKRNPTSHP
uniref:CCHC-type domain-containing protein n=1 Tax=Chenopodium quinoa TaxID=63459 RepID=A0A803LNM0_CHEQI